MGGPKVKNKFSKETHSVSTKSLAVSRPFLPPGSWLSKEVPCWNKEHLVECHDLLGNFGDVTKTGWSFFLVLPKCWLKTEWKRCCWKILFMRYLGIPKHKEHFFSETLGSSNGMNPLCNHFNFETKKRQATVQTLRIWRFLTQIYAPENW